MFFPRHPISVILIEQYMHEARLEAITQGTDVEAVLNVQDHSLEITIDADLEGSLKHPGPEAAPDGCMIDSLLHGFDDIQSLSAS